MNGPAVPGAEFRAGTDKIPPPARFVPQRPERDAGMIFIDFDVGDLPFGIRFLKPPVV